MADQQEAQKNTVVRWFEEVWNQGKREAIDEMFPVECVLHDGRAEYRGPEEFKRFYDGLQAQLSDIRVTPLQAMCGRRFRLPIQNRGTFRGFQSSGPLVSRAS